MRHDNPKFTVNNKRVIFPVLLYEITIASGSATVDVPLFPKTFRRYRVDFQRLDISTDSQLRYLVSFDDGASYVNSGSIYSYAGMSYSSSNSTVSSSGQDYFPLTGTGNNMESSVGTICNGIIIISNPGGNGLSYTSEYRVDYTDVTTFRAHGEIGSAGIRGKLNSNRVTNLRFHTSSGTIDAGVIKVYGMTV